jgi:hypothetical protein
MVATGLGVALVFGLVWVASASAALPEIGRCVAQAGGKYTSSTCTVLAKSAKTSLFEFEPGAVKNHFTLQGAGFVTELVPKVEIVAGPEKMNCTASKGEGVYTSPTSLEITQLEFTGCEVKTAKVKCQTEAAEGNSTEGKINLYPMPGKLGKTAGTKAGILLTGTHPNPFSFGTSPLVYHYECGGKLTGKAANMFVEAGIIGEVLVTDRMSPTWTYKFAKTLITHKQAITHFEGEAEEHELMEAALGPCECEAFGPDLWVSHPTITNEEPLEIKSK